MYYWVQIAVLITATLVAFPRPLYRQRYSVSSRVAREVLQ